MNAVVLSNTSLPPRQVERKRYFWTTREIAILKYLYPSGGLSPCVDALPNRSAAAIYNKVEKLGIRSPKARAWTRRRWTTNEHIDNAIRHVYRNKPESGAINRLAASVMRPRWWVHKRAQRLGLVTPRFKEPPWTETEESIVAERAHMGSHAIRRALARRGFKRTETAILLRVKRMGCCTQHPDRFTASGVAVLFGVDHTTVVGWIEKGWLKAIRHGAGERWRIRRHAIRAFVIDNVGAVDFRKVDKWWLVDLLAFKHGEKS